MLQELYDGPKPKTRLQQLYESRPTKSRLQETYDRQQTAKAPFAPPEIDHKALSPDLLASIDASQRPQMERADASRVAPQPEKTAPISREIPFTAQSDASSVARKPAPPALPSSGKIGSLEERNVGGRDLVKPLPGEPDPLNFMPKQGAMGALEGAATLPADLAVEMPRSLLRTGALAKNLIQGQSVRDALENANPLANESAAILDPIHKAVRKVGDMAVGEPQSDFERNEREVAGPLVGQMALGGGMARIKALRAARAAKDVPVAEPVAPEVQPDKWDGMASVQRQQARVADMGDVANQLKPSEPPPLYAKTGPSRGIAKPGQGIPSREQTALDESGTHHPPVKPGEPALPMVQAYHGSPHTFDKFSSEKIGTGEGAQAYGHGLYFTDKKEIAEHYRNALSRADRSPWHDIAQNYIKQAGGDRQKAVQMFRDYVSPKRPDGKSWSTLSEDEIAGVEKAILERPGATYKVDLNVEPHDLLDWDKPLSEQSPKVREALAKVGVRSDPGIVAEARRQKDAAFDRWHHLQSQVGQWQAPPPEVKAAHNDFLAALRDLDRIESVQNARGEGIYRSFGGSDARASQILRESGIPGIRYLAGQSRKAGEGAHNYVIFDDQAVAHMERNGVQLYSGIPLKAITRPVSAAALAVGGEKLSENDNPELAATGRGIMALAAFHAVGAKRFASVGRSVGRTLVEKLPTGLTEKINPDALLTPEVKGAIHQYERDVSFSKARAKEMGGKARQLGPEGDRRVSDVIEGEHFQAPLDPQTTEKVLATAAEISQEFTRQGRAKVKAGLLPEQAVAKREGSYLPRKYAEHEVPDAQSGVPSGTTAKMRIGAEHTRQDLTPEVRNKLGEIREASYRAEAGLEKGGKDLAAARLFETLRASPDAMHPDFVNASDALKTAKLANNPQGILDAQRALKGLKDAHSTKAGEWVTLPDTRGLGPLRGAVVRREVANSINGIPEIGGAGGSLLRYWKRVHTVWNPGTHVGNFFSNVSLAHLAGLPAWEQPIALARAAKELRVYGPNARALTEAGVLDANIATTTAEGAGQVGRTATSRLRELARTTRPETAGKLAEKGIQPMSGIEKGARKLDQKVGTLYNNEDNVFRVALYRKAVMRAEQGGLGMAPKDAAEYVRKSLIDYRTRSPLLNWMRNTVSPFVLFPAKALPLVAGQIVEHPWRWITLAATWGSLDQYSQQKVGRIPDEDLAARDKRSPVGYLMPGTTQLPMTNDQGDKYALDVSRYTPLNALTSNAPPGATTTALSPSFPSGLTPSGPFVDAAARLANTDPFTGDKMIRPSDTGRDITKKLTIGKMGPGAFQPGVLAQMALPSALSFHAPRVATDLANADPQAAKVDALGIIGMRPKVIRAGQETDRTMYGYHKEAEDLKQQMRQDLRKAKSTEAKISIFTDAKKKQTALMRRYEQSKAEAGR